jgi:hypothetical protein
MISISMHTNEIWWFECEWDLGKSPKKSKGKPRSENPCFSGYIKPDLRGVLGYIIVKEVGLSMKQYSWGKEHTREQWYELCQ